MMSNLKWVQNSVEPLKIFQIFALLNCFQLSVLLEVQRWRRILPSSTIWSWKCQRMPWGPALRTTRKSLKIQSWSCTIAISSCDNFCNSYVRFVGPFFATSQVEKNYNHGQLPWSKSRAWIWGTLKKLFFHLIDLLVMFFLHDALQVNAMRLVKAQARAVLNEIKKQGQQSWGLSSRAVQSCVRKGSRGYWLGVPFWSSFRWHFWIQKHFCLIKDSMTQCLICNSLDWLQRNTYPFRLWGNIAIDPCRRFCPRYMGWYMQTIFTAVKFQTNITPVFLKLRAWKAGQQAIMIGDSANQVLDHEPRSEQWARETKLHMKNRLPNFLHLQFHSLSVCWVFVSPLLASTAGASKSVPSVWQERVRQVEEVFLGETW